MKNRNEIEKIKGTSLSTVRRGSMSQMVGKKIRKDLSKINANNR